MKSHIITFVVYYRRWIAVALILLCIPQVLSLIRPGTDVLVTTAPVAAGQHITEFQTVRLTSLPDDFSSPTEDEVHNNVAATTLSAGTLISADRLVQSISTDRVVVSLPVDSFSPQTFRIGTRIHVWAVSDTHSELVSTDALMLSATTTNSSTIASLEIPRDDEFRVMQSGIVRLVAVS